MLLVVFFNFVLLEEIFGEAVNQHYRQSQRPCASGMISFILKTLFIKCLQDKQSSGPAQRLQDALCVFASPDLTIRLRFPINAIGDRVRR